jgi:hypothetical protein
MRRNAVVLILMTACAPKAPVTASPVSEGAAEAPALSADIPDTADARSFAKALVNTVVTDWEVAGGSGGAVTYADLRFDGDGTWNAQGNFTADGEKFPCVETGSWTLDDTSSSSVGTMDWTISKTTCPTREAGSSVRVQVTLNKSGAEIAFR